MCDDYESPEATLQDGWVSARKPHRCYACRETIRVGDRHHVVVQIYDGKPDRFRHCARCYAIMDAILDAGAESVQWDLNCGERWEENFGELPDEVAALAFITPDEAQERLAR